MSVSVHLSPPKTDITSSTWPKTKHVDPHPSEIARIIRPQTATLERPRILNVALLGKIDMSLTRKGLLSISKLCVTPLDHIQTPRDSSKRNAVSNKEGRHGGKTRKWHSTRKSTDDKDRHKQMKNRCRKGGAKTDIEEISSSDQLRKPARTTPTVTRREKRSSPRPNTLMPSSDTSTPVASSDNESSAGRRMIKRPLVTVKKSKGVAEEVFAGPKPADEVPEPCRTCGRPEQPERFHSHPAPTPPSSNNKHHHGKHDTNNNDDEPPPPLRSSAVKSSVRKPVPIKYRSGKTARRKSETSSPVPMENEPQKSNSTESSSKLVSTPTRGGMIARTPPPAKSPGGSKSNAGVFLILDEKAPASADKPVVPRSGPRTVLCYLCGREFGTASYPHHEPHCLQRWERENAKLPAHLQRAVPEKPSSPLTVEQWNAFAWEATQARLVPCENCGRTFNPDRLEVHQRSCKPPTGQPAKRGVATQKAAQEHQEEERVSSGGSGSGIRLPPAVYCYICGRMFGTRSIAIHEPQCLEKWRQDNNKLPENQRRPEPLKPQTRVTTRISVPKKLSPTSDTKMAAAPHAMDCYLCGREFDTRELNAHEEDCLKRWRKWNKSLPPEERLPEPRRPEFKFDKATGNMDFKATMDALWKEHLESLVPCRMGCGRTFAPDRVEVHERGCKGPKK